MSGHPFLQDCYITKVFSFHQICTCIFTNLNEHSKNIIIYINQVVFESTRYLVPSNTQIFKIIFIH